MISNDQSIVRIIEEKFQRCGAPSGLVWQIHNIVDYGAVYAIARVDRQDTEMARLILSSKLISNQLGILELRKAARAYGTGWRKWQIKAHLHRARFRQCLAS